MSRRTVLAGFVGGAALLSVAGCSDDDQAGHRARPTRPAGLAPDVAVATTALAEIRAVREAVTATLQTVPGHPLDDRVARGDAPDARGDPGRRGARPRVDVGRPRAVRRARATATRRVKALAVHEQKLHDTLDGLALRAQSGQFARLLASMGAAVAPAARGVAVMTPVEALQKTLAAEHAAVHLYGVLGGQASKSQQPTLFRQLDEAYDEHRGLARPR